MTQKVYVVCDGCGELTVAREEPQVFTCGKCKGAAAWSFTSIDHALAHSRLITDRTTTATA